MLSGVLALLLATRLLAPPECADMPLRAGTVWTYRAQVSGSIRTRDTSFTWTTRILSTLRRDSSIVAAVVNWPSDLAWWEPPQAPDTSLLVCYKEQVYHLGKSARGARSASAEAASGDLSLTSENLILSLPLHTRKLYGQGLPERTDTFYGWYVEESSPMPRTLVRLGASSVDSLYTIAYRTVPDHQIVQFAPGLGVTRYTYAHHGTVSTITATLVAARFPP